MNAVNFKLWSGFACVAFWGAFAFASPLEAGSALPSPSRSDVSSVADNASRLYLSSLRESTADTIATPASGQPLPLVSEKAEAAKPASTVLAPVKMTLSRDAVIAALQSQLGSHFAVEGELQLELLRPWTEPAKTTSPYSVTVVEFPTNLSSNVLVRVRIEAAGLAATETTLSLRAQLWRDVWATRQPVSRDDVFDPSALEPRRVDCLRERDTVSVNSGDRSQTFARNLQAGRLLSWRDLTRRSLVRKGDLVDVAAVDGPLTISMKALAMQSGVAGETIMVRNIESKKDIAALIVAENRVKVRF